MHVMNFVSPNGPLTESQVWLKDNTIPATAGAWFESSSGY
jgi:hypothetical protein